MTKISIDKEKCIGCGTCESLFPEIFKLDNDTGKSKVISNNYAEHGYDKDDIETSCPAGAISIEE